MTKGTHAFAIRNAVGLNFCTSGWLQESASGLDLKEVVDQGSYQWHAKMPHILSNGVALKPDFAF